jgi:SAM-dependent methyltransferase
MKEDQTQTKTDFDHYANDYEKLLKASTKAAGFEPSFFDEHKIKTLFKDFSSHATGTNQRVKILNFGCGIGKSEPFINNYFSNCTICSVDVSEKSIEAAKERNKEFKNIEFIKYDAIEDLHLKDTFDIIFVANVFHHIPESFHIPILTRLKTFLSPTGHLYVFEHNPQNPLTKNAFNTCEFDAGCEMIHPSTFVSMCKEAGYKTIERNYVLFFPKFLSLFSSLEKFLTWCPLGAQYYIKAN